MRLHFNNLPLIESAVRLTLDPTLPIKVTLATQVYQHVAEQYPALEDMLNFEQPPGLDANVFAKDFAPLMGFRTVNLHKGLSLTFQKRLISSRWSANQLNPRYAGFESLIEGLELGVDALQKAGVPALHTIVANMVYHDFIEGDSSSIDRLLNLAAPVYAFAEAQSKQRLVASWQEDTEIDITIDLREAKLSRGEVEIAGYQIATIAGTRKLDPKNPIEALWRLHDRLQYLFLDLLTDAAKEEWELTIEDVP